MCPTASEGATYSGTARDCVIIALIPCYNEAKYIAEVVKRTLVHLPVVVIDDGSTDGTGHGCSGGRQGGRTQAQPG